MAKKLNKYFNTVTGAVVYTPDKVKGGDWEPCVDRNKKPEEEVSKTETVEILNEGEPEVAETVEILEVSQSLEEYTVADLREMAVELDIDLHGATKKDDIILKLKESGKIF
ncbi:MAG: Rho termination factor N-terminal domain-containing protein [Eubacteriales bacterium]|nr:Rho termination factor N-terminal domain-containing protein [Eubacteriales bacterium]